MINTNVCIVTVTYGDRWQFLNQLVERIATFPQVVNLVIIDNASIYNVQSKITDTRIKVLSNQKNLGSAGGYKMGIEYAYTTVKCDFVWLLDDDNLPEHDCLDELLDKWNDIKGPSNKKALSCLREDRMAHVAIAKGANPERYYLVPDNFLGFHVFRIFKNRYYKFRERFRKQGFKKQVSMPYMPYGGMLLHRDVIANIGFPNEQFFLYVDDSEYTYRITQNGGRIWLIPAARIIDIDKSQGITYKSKLFHSQLLDEWNFRTYYHIRNRIYFYSQVAIRNKFVFGMNKVLYLTYLQVISILSNKKQAFKKLKAAIKDGLNGNLGMANPNKF